MNFKELQDDVNSLLNFNPTQTDQDFTTALVKDQINRAYERELNKAKQQGTLSHFIKTQTFTWAASSTTFELSGSLKGLELVRLDDITDTNPGYTLLFDDGRFNGDVFWKENDILQWGTSGPSEAKTIQITYMGKPETLLDDEDIPTLIPEQFHELLVWSTAIQLRRRADESSPPEWQAELRDLRLDYHKYVMTAKPHSNTITIRPSDDGAEDLLL